jgi:hypothetical protein
VLSARAAGDVQALYQHQRNVAYFESQMEEAEFAIAYNQQRHVALLHERCRVLDTRYEADAVNVRAPAAVLSGLRRESG